MKKNKITRTKPTKEAIKYMVQYMETYDREDRYVPDRTDAFVQDMIYAIGCSINPQYRYVDGYRLFLSHLKNFLEEKEE
jgi:hypothetical protein